MKSKSLIKNTGLNIVRQLSSILFPLITFPYISRVLLAENYGKVTFSQSIVSYFSLIAAFGIVNYAIRECTIVRHDKEKIITLASELYSVNIITTVFAYFLLAILLGISAKVRSYSTIILVQSVAIALSTLGVEWIFCVYEDFTYITIRSIIVQIISLVFMFIFVKKPEDYIIYSVILVVSSGGANIINYFYARKYVKFQFTLKMKFFHHLKPLLALFFSSIMITIYVNSDITMLGILRNDYEVGVYGVSVKIYTIIKNLVNAIFITTLPRVSALNKETDGKMLEALLNKIGNLIIIAIFPVLIGLILEAPNIVKIVAGESYLSGYKSLQILSFALVFSVFANFVVNLVLLPNRLDNKILYSSAVGALINILLNLIMIPKVGFVGAAITTLISELTVAVLGIVYSYKIYRFKIDLRNLISAIIGCIVIACISYYGKVILDITSDIYREAFVVIASIIGYFAVLFLLKNPLLLDFMKGKNKLDKER